MKVHAKLRFSSWVLGVSSLVLPGAFLAYQLSRLNEYAAAQPGYVCGLPILGAWLLAVGASAVLSLAASALNAFHLFRGWPASIGRCAELSLIALPLFVCVVAILSF